jgi:G8 domain
VYIPAGQNVLFDVSTPRLYSIMVEGSLIFEDKDMELHADFLVCMGGKVQIGTFEKPFTSKLTITMYGNKTSKQLPEYGNKVWAIHSCVLDMHGVPKLYTWTLLSQTAAANDDKVKLN